MKVLVIGSGGREHALVWKLLQSPKVTKLYVAPGNGAEGRFTKVDIRVDEVDKLFDFAKKERIDLTVVGPEAPLVAGIADKFRAHGLVIFGPDKAGAMMEGSKDFCRSVCHESHVKIAEGRAFTDYKEALSYLESHALPVVIKADGLAEGKGVVIAQTREEAVSALESMMMKRKFGQAGEKVVIEEFLKGYEISILAVCSGLDAVLLEPSQDHKRIYDEDKGPNTGGMGAYCPVPVFKEEQKKWVKEHIIIPVLKTLNKKGIPYRGVLFAGLMVSPTGDIRVLEFNARFGDPETQTVLPRMTSDFFELLYTAAKGESLQKVAVEWTYESCVTVVAVSSGYPGSYRKGFPIQGLEYCSLKDSVVFHAGTVKTNGQVVTNGGRVLAVSSLGKDLKEAKEKSYLTLDNISFDGMFYRRDISDKAFTQE